MLIIGSITRYFSVGILVYKWSFSGVARTAIYTMNSLFSSSYVILYFKINKKIGSREIDGVRSISLEPDEREKDYLCLC